MKNKYFIIRKSPWNECNTFLIETADHLNAKGRKARFSELEKEYPPERYVAAFTKTNEKMICFKKPANPSDDEKM